MNRIEHVLDSSYEQGPLYFHAATADLYASIGHGCLAVTRLSGSAIQSTRIISAITDFPITTFAVNKSGSLVVVGDEAGHGILVHAGRRQVLGRMKWGGRGGVECIAFDGGDERFAVGVDRKVQVWRVEGRKRCFAPFVLEREVLLGHGEPITALHWRDGETVRLRTRDADGAACMTAEAEFGGPTRAEGDATP